MVTPAMAFIGRDHADLGTALVVLLGTPGTRQKPIRATVARFPYIPRCLAVVHQMARSAVVTGHCQAQTPWSG